MLLLENSLSYNSWLILKPNDDNVLLAQLCSFLFLPSCHSFSSADPQAGRGDDGQRGDSFNLRSTTRLLKQSACTAGDAQLTHSRDPANARQAANRIIDRSSELRDGAGPSTPRDSELWGEMTAETRRVPHLNVLSPKTAECSLAGTKKSQFDEEICKRKQTSGGKKRETERERGRECSMITVPASEREANRDGESVKEHVRMMLNQTR